MTWELWIKGECKVCLAGAGEEYDELVSELNHFQNVFICSVPISIYRILPLLEDCDLLHSQAHISYVFLLEFVLQLPPAHLLVVSNLDFHCFCTDINNSLSPSLNTLFFLIEKFFQVTGDPLFIIRKAPYCSGGNGIVHRGDHGTEYHLHVAHKVHLSLELQNIPTEFLQLPVITSSQSLGHKLSLNDGFVG